MAKQRSKKSTYPSRYGGGHVTIAQYITEYLCENIAKGKGKDLPPQFWEQEEWAKLFKTQIVLLNKQLIKKYHPRAIVKSLKDIRCRNVTSFGGFLKVPKWMEVLKEYDVSCKVQDEREKQMKETVAVDATKAKPRKVHGKKSIQSTLRDLDNGEKSSSEERVDGPREEIW